MTETHVQFEKIGRVLLKEHNRIPVDVPYQNPRITCDGERRYVSVAVDVEYTEKAETSAPIGIDLGVKELAVVSNSRVFKNINKTRRMKQLEKCKKRLQQRVSCHYERIVENHCKKFRGLLNLENKIHSVSKKIRDQHTNHIHQMTSKLMKAKPEFIVIEDLNVNGMLKNHRLSKVIQDNQQAKIGRKLEYKCEWYGVKLIIADRFYPSLKLCSCYGSKKTDLKLFKRTYHRSECGITMDRDLNAAINLMQYGMHEMSA